ncbi:unnamed protein product, partial [Mycena citricolor]
KKIAVYPRDLHYFGLRFSVFGLICAIFQTEVWPFLDLDLHYFGLSQQVVPGGLIGSLRHKPNGPLRCQRTDGRGRLLNGAKKVVLQHRAE